MSKSELTVANPGDRVFTSEDSAIGTVKAVRNNYIEVGDARFWLPETAVADRGDKVVRLGRDYDFLAESGTENHRSRGKLFAMVTLVGTIAAAIFAFQRRRGASRENLSSGLTGPTYPLAQSQPFNNGSPGAPPPPSAPTAVASSEIPPAQAGKSEPMGTLTTPEAIEESSAGQELPPFAALDLSDRVVTEKELEIVALVSHAFPERSVQANAIGVHTLGGAEVATLRFTVDETASSDIVLSRLEATRETAEALAQEVIEELQVQLPKPS